MGLFSSGQSSSEQKPWSGQQRTALGEMYKAVWPMFQEGRGQTYAGSTYAGLTPQQQAAINAVQAYTQGRGGVLNQNVGGVANQYMGLAPTVQGNLGDIYSRAGQSSAPGILSDAQLYADNPYMQGMIQAATRDDVRAVTEGYLPQLEAGAAGTGNTNSSRTGMEAAILRRGLEDRIADVSAGMRGGAYQQGLGIAQGDQQSRTGTQLNATGQMGGLVGQGLGAAAQDQSMALASAQGLLGAGGVAQADQQAQLDEMYKKWLWAQERPWELMSRMSGVLIPQTGTQGIAPGTPQASPFQQFTGAGLAIGGILGGL